MLLQASLGRQLSCSGVSGNTGAQARPILLQQLGARELKEERGKFVFGGGHGGFLSGSQGFKSISRDSQAEG